MRVLVLNAHEVKTRHEIRVVILVSGESYVVGDEVELEGWKGSMKC